MEPRLTLLNGEWVLTDDDKNGGIIRWRDLTSAVDKLRGEVKDDTNTLRAGQQANAEDITQLRSEVSSLRAEMRIMGAILISLLLTIIGLFINHLGSVTP